MDFAAFKQMDLGAILEVHARQAPDRVACVAGDRRLTFGELDTEANAVAAGLAELGVVKGDRVAVILPNWPEFVAAYFAAAKLGAILVPLNTRYRTAELSFMLQNSGARVLLVCSEFAGFDYLPLVAELWPGLPGLQQVVVVGDGDLSRLGREAWRYPDLVARGAGRAYPRAALDPREDVFSILFTSGTTGIPKGAMLTHYNLAMTASTTAELMACEPSDVFLVAVPFFHIFGLSASIACAYASGAPMVLMDVYKPEEALRLVQQERITVHHGVPTMFIMELNHPNFRKYDLSSLRTGIIAAAPCPVEVVRRIRGDMGCDIAVAYGLTETSPTLTITRFTDNDTLRAETVGQPLPGVEIKIIDDEWNGLPRGQTGELAAWGFGIMKGYWQQPEATAEVLNAEGWFRTGDLATMDENDYVRIVGRKKEMISRGGYKIYPREVEELLYTHPGVEEVAVVGLPNPVLGEESCACVRLKAGATATEDEIRGFLSGKLADYKVPDRVQFVDAFPMTASGKIRKVDLREQLSQR